MLYTLDSVHNAFAGRIQFKTAFEVRNPNFLSSFFDLKFDLINYVKAPIMTDIRVEVLGSSIPNVRMFGGQFYYKIKSNWCSEIEFTANGDGKYFTRIPSIPLIDHFVPKKDGGDKGLHVFLEVWHRYVDEEDYMLNKFLGLTELQIVDQLKTQNLNPSIKWLDIYDPIQDVNPGKVLLEIYAKFVNPERAERLENSGQIDSRSTSGDGNGRTSKSMSPQRGSAYFKNSTNSPGSTDSTRSIEMQRQALNLKERLEISPLKKQHSKSNFEMEGIKPAELMSTSKNEERAPKMTKDKETQYNLKNQRTNSKFCKEMKQRRYLTSEEILAEGKVSPVRIQDTRNQHKDEDEHFEVIHNKRMAANFGQFKV